VTDRQTDRVTDRQTDRQTDSNTERNTNVNMCFWCPACIAARMRSKRGLLTCSTQAHRQTHRLVICLPHIRQTDG